MRRLFPIIITLVTISLLGIIFLQFQWITSAIQLKQDQYQSSVNTAITNVRDTIISRKNNFVYTQLNHRHRRQENKIATRMVMTTYELKDLIRTELKNQNVKQDFEYCITNESAQTTLFSSGFRTEYLSDAKTFRSDISGKVANIYETLHIYILQPEDYFQHQLMLMIVGAIIFTTIIIAAFVLTIRTMLSQKRLSEIKSDFINNMTHEFKTPIATIQLATDAMNNEKVLGNTETIKYYNGIIKEENRRMHGQVEKILNAGQLEKDKIKLQLKTINVHEIIRKVIANSKLHADEVNAIILPELNAVNYLISADEVHFSNIVFNLLDNAIKYSRESPEIAIETHNIGKSIHIKFKDNGIGMNKETLNHIFEKFYRAHTGNVHNVKGFGLGLTYVKKVVELHGAKINVESKLQEGSTFTLIFPVIQPG